MSFTNSSRLYSSVFRSQNKQQLENMRKKTKIISSRYVAGSHPKLFSIRQMPQCREKRHLFVLQKNEIKFEVDATEKWNKALCTEAKKVDAFAETNTHAIDIGEKAEVAAILQGRAYTSQPKTSTKETQFIEKSMHQLEHKLKRVMSQQIRKEEQVLHDLKGKMANHEVLAPYLLDGNISPRKFRTKGGAEDSRAWTFQQMKKMKTFQDFAVQVERIEKSINSLEDTDQELQYAKLVQRIVSDEELDLDLNNAKAQRRQYKNFMQQWCVAHPLSKPAFAGLNVEPWILDILEEQRKATESERDLPQNVELMDRNGVYCRVAQEENQVQQAFFHRAVRFARLLGDMAEQSNSNWEKLFELCRTVAKVLPLEDHDTLLTPDLVPRCHTGIERP